MLNPPKEFLERIGFDGSWLDIKLPTFDDTGRYSFLATLLFGAVCEHFKIGFDDRRLNTQKLCEVVMEAIMNAAEHGNKLASEKIVTLNLWLGPKGVIFAVGDEGDFYKSLATKKLIESRTRLPTTKQGPGGSGMDCIYEADEVFVSVEENALYLLVLANSVVSTKGWGWVPARKS